MKKLYLFFLFLTAIGFSQPIVVNTTTHTVPQLVEDVLIDSPCALVSNISWSSGATLGTRTGIGYFTNTNPNFPISAGVVMNTGSLTNVPGPNTTTLGDGAWPGDNQLFNYIQALGIDPGLEDYNDATIIEFDFMPLTNQMSFNFLFASEEYGTFQCDYSDAFAFFLTDVTTGTVTNLALVPGTSIPVSVITVRDNANNAGCSSENIAYFGQSNEGSSSGAAAINFNGQTVLMTAESAVTPNSLYHIKLVVADRNDNMYNSAVFIEAGSFNVGVANLSYPKDEGVISDDMTIANGLALCPGETKVVDSGLNPADYSFVWTHNSVVIAGETGATLTISQPGTYCLQANNASGSSCTQDDCIVVEYLPGITINSNPDDLVSCDNIFNLNDNIPSILGVLDPFEYDVLFFASEADALAGSPQIPSPTNFNATNTVTPIYVKVENFSIPCPAYTQFDAVVITSLPTATISGTTTIPIGSTTVVTFVGTPNAVVSYTINGGAIQTITLDTSGNASITTLPLSVNTTYNLVSVSSGCVVSLAGSAIITVTNDPTASVTANTICSGTTGT
ncbi:choice-of-anchor L domain-containing protein, partial [uncultured Flavobacterium sp.]|uniref:choice-of-anchor L domain-containing protein n=1 Tax=uncultured Flavobacterium sp. TaxID=165435 RepID=UPI00259774D6